MKALNIARKVAQKLNLDEDFVVKVYKNYWREIKTYLESLPLKEELSREEFEKLQRSINISSVGKIYVDWDRYARIKRAFAYKYNKGEYDERYNREGN